MRGLQPSFRLRAVGIPILPRHGPEDINSCPFGPSLRRNLQDPALRASFPPLEKRRILQQARLPAELGFEKYPHQIVHSSIAVSRRQVFLPRNTHRQDGPQQLPCPPPNHPQHTVQELFGGSVSLQNTFLLTPSSQQNPVAS